MIDTSEHATPEPRGSLLSREHPWSDRAFWRDAMSKILTQEEWVRSDIVKGVSEKLEFVKKTFEGQALINDMNLTYVDLTVPPERRRQRPIQEMTSPRIFKPLKALAPEMQKTVVAFISTVRDKREDAEQNLDDAEIEKFTDMMVEALRDRQEMRSINDEVVKMMDSIVGFYKFDEEYHFRISVDPIDIVMKAAGQTWGWVSCENLHSEAYPDGSFSDIVFYNAIAYVEDRSGKAIGRIMIRWCNPGDDKGAYDMGIESVFYGGNGTKVYLQELESKGTELVEGTGLYGFDLYKSLHGHLSKKNRLKYGTCSTPYRYGGYSDAAGGHEFYIRYRAWEYPLKYKGQKMSKFDEIMSTTNVRQRLLIIREELRRPVSTRRISIDEAMIAFREMPGDLEDWIQDALSNAPEDMIKILASLFSDQVDPFNLDAHSDYFGLMRKASQKREDEYDAIYKGSMNLLVEHDDFKASKLFAILSQSKDWPWSITNQNYAYAAVTSLRWFADVNSKACPGKVETAVASIALQVLSRAAESIDASFDLSTQSALFLSNKVTVVGALVAYYDSIISKSDAGTNRHVVYTKNMVKAIEKYVEMYAYSDGIIDGWLDHGPYKVGVSCDACGVDEGMPNPKWFTFGELEGTRKVAMTLCSQCATKVFIVWCGDTKTYDRRIRAVRYYYAGRNYAPETYCEKPSEAKTSKKFKVKENASISTVATRHLSEIGFKERFWVKFGGKIDR